MGLLGKADSDLRRFAVPATALALVVLGSCAPTGGRERPDLSPARSSTPSTAEAAGAKAQNPFPGDERSVRVGRAVYTKNCQSCHGSRGKGDGPVVRRLNVEVPDLTDADVQSETDGELFAMISKGSKPMPAYRKLLGEEQRWHVVNYLRAAFGAKLAT